MRKTWAIAVKELKQASRDLLTLLMLLGLPLFMLVLYGFALDFDVENVALAIEDRDLSTASRRLVDALVNTGRFEVVRGEASGIDPRGLTEAGNATVILIIPRGYGSDLAMGTATEVQLLVDGVDSNTAATILGYVNGLVSAIDGQRLRGRLLTEGTESALAAAIRVEPRVWYNPELASSRFLVPGLIAFILMLTTVLSTALSVVREKERGTVEQLNVAPLRTVQILLGKLLPYLLIGLAGMSLVVVAARLLFGVEVEGPYLDLYLATLLFLVAGLSWGLLVSTIADSQPVAFQISVLSSLLPTLLLSGFVFPIRTMPEVLQLISRLVPARYYLVVLRGVILKGAGLEPFWDQMGYLGVYTGVVLVLASVRFARQRS